MKNLFVLLLALFPACLTAQNNFSRALSVNNDSDGNTAYKIQPYEDGFLILVARSDNVAEYAALVKINQSGDVEWAKKYYYLDGQSYPPDPGRGMYISPSHIYIGCQTPSPNLKLMMQIMCIDRQTLDVAWVKSYPNFENHDYILDIIGTPDNELILMGAAAKPTGGSTLKLIKTDSLGNELWTVHNNEFARYSPDLLNLSVDGGILVAFTAAKAGEFFPKSVLAKYDQDGNNLWTKPFETSEEGQWRTSVSVLQNGDLAFVGIKDTIAPWWIYPYPPTIYILDPEGNTKRYVSYNGRFEKGSIRMVTLDNGDILCVGYARNPLESYVQGGWLARLSPAGDSLWQRPIFDTRFYLGALFDAVSTPDGGIVAVGGTRINAPPYQSLFWILKVDGNGCYQWDCLNPLIISNAEDKFVPSPGYNLTPNPATQYIQVNGLTGKERLFECITLDGRTLRTFQPQATGLFKLEDLPKGMYFLKITLENGSFQVLQFVKE